MTQTEQDKQLKKATKKNLKVMRHTKVHHPVRAKGRVIKYGAKGFTRNIWLSAAATVVMSITFVVLFATIVVNVLLGNLADGLREKVNFAVFMNPGLTEEKLDEISEVIKTDPNVKSVEKMTSERGYKEYFEDKEENKKTIEAMDEEEKQKTIASMPTVIRFKVYDTEDIESVKDLIATNVVIQENISKTIKPNYDTKSESIARVVSWAKIAQVAGIVLAAVFLGVSMLIIFSTIRMAIFARREEIYMMKLVGADKMFVRGPFLVEAETCGVIAGAIAAAISYFGFMGLAPWLTSHDMEVGNIEGFLQSSNLVFVIAAFIVAGILVGRISAWMAISKYLHKA